MMTYLAIKKGARIKATAVVGGITDLEQAYKEREMPRYLSFSRSTSVDRMSHWHVFDCWFLF
jgi:hypothetical protein